jgi:HK97 family phage major capsid protein
MSTKLKELRGQLNERRDKLGKVFEEAGEELDLTKVTSLDGADDQAKADQIKALNDEMTDLGKQIDEIQGMQDMKTALDKLGEKQPHPGFPTRPKETLDPVAIKSIGELFAESGKMRKADEGRMGEEANFDVDIKAALFNTGAGWAAPTIRSDRVVPFAVRPLVLADLLPVVNVTLPSYLYMEETTFTNSAATVAEAASKPEVALALTERTEIIRKIAGYLPVTDEQLDDVPAARQYIDNRLGYMVRQILDTQIVAGNASGTNLVGINHSARSGVQQEAKSSDSTHDATYKAMTKIRVNAFSEPNAAIFHPNDWQDVRLAVASGSGIYLFGPPSDPGVERIWGLNVVQTTGMPEGTALVGDFNQAALLLREGLTMKVGYVNDDLIKNRQTIVAELRAAVAVFRPAAFCEVTGV